MDETETAAERRRSQATEIITSGRIWSAVWYLAWPTAINTLIQTAYTLINRRFVGQLPDATGPLAAIGIGGTVLMIQFGILMALATGTSALVSRFLGAGQHQDADEATGQALVLSVIAGALSGLPFIVFAEPVARLVGAEAGVARIAGDYTAIISWFSVPLFVYFVIVSVLRSAGDARSPLYVGAAVLVFNAIVDYLLIFGVGRIPAMGVHGAAIATGLSRVVGMLLACYFLRRSVLGGAFAHIRPHAGWFGRILNIGWPAAIQNFMWSTAVAGFIKVLGLLPPVQATAAQAAYTVAVGLEGLAFMPGLAYSQAATPLVGQNLGAGKPDRAAQSAWVAVGQAVFIMTAVAVVFLLVPKQLALMFTDEAAVVPLIVSYLMINAVSEPFLAVAMVLRGALQGAGDTRTPMILTITTLWVIRVPLTWLLAVRFGLGANGAWIAMSATTVLSGLLLAGWFKLGRWRDIRV